MIPVDGGAPVRLVAGQAVNPVWSPDGRADCVRRSGRSSARSPLLGDRPDGNAGRAAARAVRPAAIASCRTERLVYLPRNQSLDFWLLDLRHEGDASADPSRAIKGAWTSTFDDRSLRDWEHRADRAAR